MDSTLPAQTAAGTEAPLAPVAAIFDLDDTLVAASTGRLIVKYLREARLLRDYAAPASVFSMVSNALLHRYASSPRRR